MSVCDRIRPFTKPGLTIVVVGRGHRWTNLFETVLEELFRDDGRCNLGRRLFRPRTHGGLQARAQRALAGRGRWRKEAGTSWQEDRAETYALSQRLAGASLLILANKQDIGGAMTSAEIAEVRARLPRSRSSGPEPKSDLLLDRLCNSSFSYLTRLTFKPALRAWKESVKVGKAINAFGLDSTGSCRRSRSGSTTEPERF